VEFLCRECNATYPLTGLQYKCSCGGLFNLKKKSSQEEIEIKVSLGERVTPMISKDLAGNEVDLKLDYMTPTGSFKDRGALALINKLHELGITEIVEDSSGNAGTSIAAYCAAAGIKCNLYLPVQTPESKIAQAKAYGANIIKVEGTRQKTAEAVLEAAETTYYASHVYNPLFFEGTKSIAYEIYKQSGIPDYIFSPVGNGTLLLGIRKGFKEIGDLPRIIGVQSSNCCPIYNEYYSVENGENETDSAETISEGIEIEAPARQEQIIEAIRESKGDVVKVSPEKIKAAHLCLSEEGIYVETTAAAALAGGWKFIRENEISNEQDVVIPLTGTGLKK
jgi:threonine synthase